MEGCKDAIAVDRTLTMYFKQMYTQDGKRVTHVLMALQ